jgi:ribosomal protein S4E
MQDILILDTVAATHPIEKERLTLVEPDYMSIESLPSGQVGTIVEIYERDREKQYLVEFSDQQGREYAMAILKEDELLVLHYDLEVA